MKLNDKTLLKHHARPFFVFAAKYNSDIDWSHEEYFETLEEAENAYEGRSKKGTHKSVVLGEIGIYSSDSGEEIQDYIMFSWRGCPDYTEVCGHPARGFGLPHSLPREAVRYHSIINPRGA